MSMSVTPGGAREIIGHEKGDGSQAFQPIMQVLSIKSVAKNSGDRYRAILSDGEHFVQGMLATQLNHLVVDNSLQANSLVKVRQFMKNSVQGRIVIIVLSADVVGNPGQRIGQPTDIEKAGNAALNASRLAHSNAPAPMYNAPPQSNQAYPSAARSNPYTPAATGVVGNNNPYGGQAPNHLSAPKAPIARSVASNNTPFTQISALNMYQNRWTIKARVVVKSEIKTWSNNKGEGSLFSAEFLDSSGVDIRGTFFKEAVDKFYSMLQVGSVYTVSGGRLKVANMQYNKCKSSMEITFDQNAEIHLQDDGGEIQVQPFELVKIAEIENIEANKSIDVMGIVQDMGEVVNFVAKKSGKEMTKREVTIVDDSGAHIRLTLWGEDGIKFEEQGGAVGKVVAFRRARVSDFGGKTLSGSSGGTFPEPQIPETVAMQQWWAAHGSSGLQTKSLSSSGGMGGRMDNFSERKSIGDIKAQNLGYENEKGDYLSFKAHFTFLKKDKEGGAWYPACPNKEDPCRNRCKVTQTTDGNWQCDRCQGTYPNCNRKWIFSGTVADGTSSTWVSVFDEQATQLFGGVSADQAFAEYENQDVYDSHFARANFTEWVFKCRVKNEMVNEEPRLKTQVVRMDPVNYAQESMELIQELEKMRV